MLSSVFLSGRLGEIKADDPNVRYIEVDRTGNYGGHSRFVTEKIPVMSIAPTDSFFYTAPVGANIILKGSIYVDDNGFIGIIDEVDEITLASDNPRIKTEITCEGKVAKPLKKKAKAKKKSQTKAKAKKKK